MTAGSGPERKTRADRKAATAALAAAPATVSPLEGLKAFVDHAPMAVALFDREMRWIKANTQFLAACDLTAEQTVGQCSYDQIPGSREQFSEVHRRCLAGARDSSPAVRFQLPTGEKRWMAWDISPWRDADGSVGGLMVIARDVTAQKEAEEDVRRTKAFTQAVLENVPTSLVVKNEDGRLLMMNRAMEELYGISRDRHLGLTMAEAVAAPQAERIRLEDEEVLRTGGPMVVNETRPLGPNGEIRSLRKVKLAITNPSGGRAILTVAEDVTDQLKAQADLEHTRAFLTTVLDRSPIPMVVQDARDGRIIMTNRANEALVGKRRVDLIGKSARDLFPAEQAEYYIQHDQAALNMGEVQVIEESRMNTPHNGERIVRVMKAGIHDPDGAPCLLTVCEDITQRKQDAEELRRSRVFFSLVLESVPAAMVVKDAETGRVLMMNRAMEAMYDIRREEQVGRTAHEVMPFEMAEQVTAEDLRARQTGEVLTIEESETYGGRQRFVRKTKVAVKDPEGPTYLLSISEDITERRHTHEELERTRAFLTTIIDNMPAGLSVKDATNGRVLILNRAVEEMYGVERGENVGKTGAEVFTPEQATQFDQMDREVIASGELRVFEEQPIVTPRNGVRYLRKKKILVRNPDGGGDYLLGISEDVTERRQAEEALIEALTRAEAANVAKSEFLANMSHEIRTPLNGVLGLADALSRMQLQPKQEEIVRMIVSSGKALTMILGDVLDLAKAEAGALELNSEAFSLSETLGSAAYLFETVARDKGLEFRVEVAPDGPDRLVGDPLRIKQVVSNLISNAVKFTTHGSVTVKASSRLDADGEVSLHIEVVDTGPGFSKETGARLFGRFEQGDGSITRRFGGTGLGLSIAGALSQMMGGDVTCSAVEGKGATFCFTARVKLDPRSAAEAASNDHQAVEISRSLRVLLAEDHPVNQRVVQLMLGDLVDLVIVDDGQAALNAFTHEGPFDVILMDTQMPVMDGMTATRLIREGELARGAPRTPIISLTANAMAHQVQACMEAGADFHLPKPITSDGLLSAIQHAIEASPDPEAQRVA